VLKKCVQDTINSHFVLTIEAFFQVPLVEQELSTLPEYMGSPPDFSEVRATGS
jgi:hypothetical protein